MGKVKLTLTIQEHLVINGKMAAKISKKSLSELIEGYLSGFKPVDKNITSTSVALTLRGIAKSALSKKTDREIKSMMYKEKYGI